MNVKSILVWNWRSGKSSIHANLKSTRLQDRSEETQCTPRTPSQSRESQAQSPVDGASSKKHNTQCNPCLVLYTNEHDQHQFFLVTGKSQAEERVVEITNKLKRLEPALDEVTSESD